MSTYANLDDITSDSRTLCRGAWSPRRENSLYSGPTLRIRRGSDNVLADFYADAVGRLYVSSTLTGTQIQTWSSNATLFVNTLYDQSGSGNHTTANTVSLQPILANYTPSNAQLPTFYLDTRTGRHLAGPTTVIPAGAMTVIARHGAIDSTNGCLISGGGTTANTGYSLKRDSTVYRSSLVSNDIVFSRYAAGSVVAETIDASGNNRLFVNGDLDATGRRPAKNTATGSMRLANNASGEVLNGDFLYAFVFSGVITDAEIDTLSLRFKRGNVIRLPSLETYVGSASNLGNRELLLCSASNTSGKYVYQADIAPNFTAYFDARVPSWSNNSFRFGLHSTLQSFYYAAPNSNLLRMLDMNGNTLQSWALSPFLSNNAYNSFKLINSESNMIMCVNNKAYAGLLPNHPRALKNWKNGCFSFEASNLPTITGSNAVRRFYSQSITRLSDPVVIKDSLTSTVMNTAKLGANKISTRTIDANVIFTDWAFSSNLYSTSNCTLCNLSASNIRTPAIFTSNIFASNLGTAAFCNLIPFNMITGAAACNGSNFTTVTANTIYNNTLFSSNIRTRNTLNMNDSSNADAEIAISSLTVGLSGTQGNYVTLGRDNGLYNSATFGYTHVNNSVDTNFWTIGINGTNRILNVTAQGRAGIMVSNPTRTLDVNGDARIRANAIVDASLTAASAVIPTVTASNLASSNVSAGNLTLTGTITANNNVTITGILNVNNRNLNVFGGTGATPTVLAINSTNALNTTGVLQFVNASHRISCTDSNPFDTMTAIGVGGHNMFYRSGGHNFSGAIAANSGVRLGGGLTVKDLRVRVIPISAQGSANTLIVNEVHNYNWAGTYYTHFVTEDLTAPSVIDSFGYKVVAKNSNDMSFNVNRLDTGVNGWSRAFNVIVFMYLV